MSLGKKLTISFLVTGAVVMALSISSLRAIRLLGFMLDQAANGAARQMDLITSIRTGFDEMEMQAKKTQFIHSIHTLDPKGESTCAGCHAAVTREQSAQEFEKSALVLTQDIEQARPLIRDPEEKAALDAIENGVRKWVVLNRVYLEKVDTGFDAGHELITGQMLPILTDIDKATRLLADKQRAFFATSSEQAKSTTSRNLWSVLALVALGGIITLAVILALRRTSLRLHELARELGDKAGEVAGDADKLFHASETLAQGAERQSESLEEVSVNTADISSTAQQNAANAGTSAQVSSDLGQRLASANKKLEQMMAAMQAIQGSSGKITHTMKVIDGIAFQTNILALNAAVEAARAGESGQGFAVVASEVRNLAQRSAQAAQETAGLVDESLAASRTGMERLADVIEAFRLLSQGAETMTRLAGEVRTGSLDQAHNIEEISERIRQVGTVTTEAATHAEETARAGEGLTAHAGDLRQIVGRLVGIVGAGSRRA